MNDKLVDLINTKGPEIAQTLKVATEQVYDKVLWYVRVDGIIDVATFLVTLLLIIPWYKITKKIVAQDKKQGWGGMGDGFIWGTCSVVGIVFLLFGGVFINELITSASKIFVPEYYLINQIILKLGN